MNWTNEMEHIKQISDQLLNKEASAEKECKSFCTKKRSFYLEKHNGDFMEEYGFGTVAELENMLDEHWKKCDISCLEDYKKLICISAFKNRHIHKNTGEVSEYVYEF